MPDLAALRHRWARLTNQDIGEAQNAIQALLEALEAAMTFVEAEGELTRHEDRTCPKCQPTHHCPVWFTLQHEYAVTLTAFRAQAG